MVNNYIELIFGAIARSVACGRLFPGTGVGTFDHINGLNHKLYDFLSAKGMKLPVGFRYIDLCSLYIPYSNYWDVLNSIDEGPNFIDSKLVTRRVNKFVLTLSMRAEDFARRMVELCLVFGVELTPEEKELEIQKYLYLELVQQSIPQLKFSTNLAFTKFWNEESPEGSSINFMGLHLFPSRLRVCLNRICSKDGRRKYRNQILINTCFQGYKKGLMPAGPETVQKSLNTNRAKLTKDGTISEDLYLRIQKKTRAIMSTGKPLKFSRKDTVNQSSHSTLASDFGKGGNIGFVRREIFGNGPYYTREFIGMVFDKEDRSCRTPISVYALAPVFLGDMLGTFRHLPFSHVLSDDFPEDKYVNNLYVAPACILEPMKVRIITKPSTGLHVRMHKIQKSLWKWLYTHETGFFDLIGEPLTPNHLYPLLKDMQVGDKICSGDYSAATDNLKGEVTRAIATELFHDIKDPILVHNLIKSLTETKVLQTKIILPKWGNVFDEFAWNLKDFDQTNGQLMGHVISFVILCLANVIAYWISLENKHLREIALSELVEKYPVRVNGDDIIFRSTDSHYSVWLDTIGSFGFEPSQGKNFFNDKFLQVNSELYRLDTYLCDEGVKLRQIVQIPYVNFGLLTNRSKQDCSKDTSVQRIQVDGSTVSKLDASGISSDLLLGRLKTYPFIYEKLMKGLPNSISASVSKLVERHYKPVFRAFGLGPLFKHLGNEAFRDVYAETIVKNRKYNTPDEAAQLECFNDLALKLDRGTLEFEFYQAKQLQRICAENPFFRYPTIDISKREFIRA